MARSLKPIEAGFASLLWSAEPEGDPPEELVFDPADWRFELGSLAATPMALKFDPRACELCPEQIGFAPGWNASKP